MRVSILSPSVNLFNGYLAGNNIGHSSVSIGDLVEVFREETIRKTMDPKAVVYEVDAFKPVEDGSEGGLFFGVTRINSGAVGKEYFMTRGHYHTMRNRCEFYWGISGKGLLILLDENRQIKVEEISPGSVNFIPGYTAHRMINTGDGILTFGACWPSDAGHDYEAIRLHGFGVRVIKNGNGEPEILPEA